MEGDRRASSSPTPFAAGSPSASASAAESDAEGVVRRAEKRGGRPRARASCTRRRARPRSSLPRSSCAAAPVVVAVLSKVDAVASWRERIGPADPNVARETHPESLRAQLGVALRNVVHGSATVKDAAREKEKLHRGRIAKPSCPRRRAGQHAVPGLDRGARRPTSRNPRTRRRWMSHVSHQRRSRRGRQRGVAHLSMVSDGRAANADAGAECHRHVLGAPLVAALGPSLEDRAIRFHGAPARAEASGATPRAGPSRERRIQDIS